MLKHLLIQLRAKSELIHENWADGELSCDSTYLQMSHAQAFINSTPSQVWVNSWKMSWLWTKLWFNAFPNELCSTPTISSDILEHAKHLPVNNAWAFYLGTQIVFHEIFPLFLWLRNQVETGQNGFLEREVSLFFLSETILISSKREGGLECTANFGILHEKGSTEVSNYVRIF